jgi:tetratricopeptide (TPR) repeat protein
VRWGLLALIAVVFLPTLNYGFVYDDGWTLRSNGFLREFDLGVLFSRDALSHHVPDAFRPTLVVFDAASYAVIGLRPWAHHALSVLLHVGVCALVLRLLRRRGAPLLLSGATTLLFGVMAIHAEAVAVISFREDLIAALLGLAAMLVADRSLDRPRASAAVFLLIACALQALACGAKMSAAPLPIFWALLLWCGPWKARPPRSRAIASTSALLLGTALSIAHLIALHGSTSPYDPANNPRILATRVGAGPVLAASTEIHVGYLQQMLLPMGLSPEYVDQASAWSDPGVLLSAFLLCTIGAVGLWCLRRNRHGAAAIALLGFLLLALPTSNLFGMPNMRADRFMYLPSLAVCIGLAFACIELGRKVASRTGDPTNILAPALILAVIQGSFCFAATAPYANDRTLWEVAVQRAPTSARAQAVVGINRLSEARGRENLDEDLLEVVRAHCEEATRLDPEYELPEICHARLAVAQKRWRVAHRHLKRALDLSPDRNDRILASLAKVSLDLQDASPAQREALAEDYLDRGLREYPYSPEIHATAAHIAHRSGKPEAAMDHYRRARSLRPERWETVVGGVELALDLGDAPAAYRTWYEEHDVLGQADPATRATLRRRLTAARRNQGFTLLQSLCRPGVFPDEP